VSQFVVLNKSSSVLLTMPDKEISHAMLKF
jgi:hypothetical protein